MYILIIYKWSRLPPNMGGRPPAVSDNEILAVFEESDDPVLFTSEVTDSIPIEQQGTRQRLNELYSEGLLEKKQTGKCVVWWISDKGKSI